MINSWGGGGGGGVCNAIIEFEIFISQLVELAALISGWSRSYRDHFRADTLRKKSRCEGESSVRSEPLEHGV